jgi:hypothetical protein
MQRTPRLLHHRQPIIRLLLGMSYLIVAIAVGIFGAQSASAEAVRIEQLPHLDSAESKNGTFVCSLKPTLYRGAAPGNPVAVQIPIGSEVLIEGQLSSLNPPRYRDFIAYVREEYRGTNSDGSAIWSEDKRVTPSLRIDLASGSVRLSNSDYRLDSPHQRWQNDTTLVATNLGLGGTRRYTGLTVNRPVTAIGVLVNGPSGPELRSSFVFGGTRAEYIATQLGTAAYLPWIGLVAGVIGVALIAFTLWRMIAARKPAELYRLPLAVAVKR